MGVISTMAFLDARQAPRRVAHSKRYFLSENRGRARIWLDGRALDDAGFAPGARYSRAVSQGGTISLTIDPAGVYVVSHKDRGGRTIPVIDINTVQIDQLLGDARAIEVRFGLNSLTIQRSRLDQRIAEREERFVEAVRAGRPLECGSLYHGGGVLDSGLHEGFAQQALAAHVRVAVEMEQEYLECSVRNNSFWADGAFAMNSPMELTIEAGDQVPQLSVLTAGIPCTGASKSGKAKNQLEFAEDHKSAGAQVYYALRWIELTNPAMIIIENVREYANTASWSILASVLKTSGYQLQTRTFNGVEFGALENRNRFVAVALSQGLAAMLTFDLDAVQGTLKKPATLSEILDEVPADSEQWKSYSYLKAKQERDIADGKMFRMQWLDPSVATEVGTIGRGYSKGRSTEPFVISPFNPEMARLLTVAEHARVKTIPESMVAGVDSVSVAHQILGQSVVREWFVRLGAVFAAAVAKSTLTAPARQAALAAAPVQADLEW